MKNKYPEFSVTVDNDPTLNLETKNFFRKGVDFFFLPILNRLPKSFSKQIRKSSAAAERVMNNTTNHVALETLYRKGKHFPGETALQDFFRKIWFNLGNSKAVRNRLKLVMREMRNHLGMISTFDKEIHVLSIASGSARAIIETVEHGSYLAGTNLSITFVDKNPHAIEYSKNLSKNISHFNLQWVNDTVGGFMKNADALKDRFDIVEIVGLFDYFDDEKLLTTLKDIHKILQKGGIVITANINNNNEQKFITHVISWPMVYRSVEKLAALVSEAGFPQDTMKIFYEPLKIHGIVIAKK